MSSLFSPLALRSTTFPHRAWVSPMCQYSAVDGIVQPWHRAHYGSFAIGRAGLVISEAAAVVAEGRITPEDAGIWSDAHAEAWEPIVAFSHEQGVPFAFQLAHAGRKASTYAPWRGAGSVPLDQGGWPTLAPSAQAFGAYAVPAAMTLADIVHAREGFVSAAVRADSIGADAVELHFAHGYLAHEFLSPLSNGRDDSYGGSLENRMRFALEIVAAVRAVWPEDKALLMRVSATDWVDGGWDVDSTVDLARRAHALGVDLVDVSSAGNDPRQQVQVGPAYQVPFAARVRAEAGVPTAAVGLVTDPAQADAIVADGLADAVLLGREMLRDPHWSLRAAHELGADLGWPDQYLRARPA
jgi:2,4-dienoyl-CoA reductase-like NADH-dependent reductase (Old Yellow Enzyme family)